MKYLKLKHLQQPRAGECLAACVTMILDYIGRQVRYRRLFRILKIIRGAGTASFNVRNLEQLGYRVLYQHGTLNQLRRHLEQNQPCIAFIETGELPYWDENVSHAVVVVGIDEQHVYLHDPAYARSPIRVSIGDFDLAWLGHDELYAVILRSIENRF